MSWTPCQACRLPVPVDWMDDPSKWISITQAAKLAQLDSRAVRHAVQRGQLPCSGVRGKGYEVRCDSLAVWLESRQQSA